jgi:outer membrane lipoprotein-sorting protein
MRKHCSFLTKESETMDAQTILKKTKMTYAKCTTYSDTGLVSTTFLEPESSRVSDKPFSTAFVREGGFRFEYSGKHPFPLAQANRYIIWTDGTTVRTWWDIRPGIEDKESLAMALAGATGVSGGSANTVPSLLMPAHASGALITDLMKPRLLESDTQEGSDCFRIEGEQPFGDNDTIVLWIDQKNYLIRRIDTSHTFPDFRTETTTTYYPALNGTVEKDTLEFNPPREQISKKGDSK